MNAFSGIETPQFRHLFLCQRKIENSEILFHSVCVSRFRKNDKSVLSFKSKNDGSGCFAVLFGNFQNKRMGKQRFIALSERSPRFDFYIQRL